MESNDFKIKDRFPINLSSRSEEKRIKFTKWLNAQSNAQNSFLALVEHMVDRFGYTDITDYEVAKKLFTEKLEFDQARDYAIKNDQQPTAVNHSNERVPEESTFSTTETAARYVEPEKETENNNDDTIKFNADNY